MPAPPVTIAFPVTANLASARCFDEIPVWYGGGAVRDELPSDSSMNGRSRAVRASRATDMAFIDELSVDGSCVRPKKDTWMHLVVLGPLNVENLPLDG